MTNRYILIFIIILFSVKVASCQRIIIYTDDIPYLMPSIESIMINIRNTDLKNQPYFSEVANLSRFIENIKDEQAADDLRQALSNDEYLSVEVESGVVRTEIAKILSDFDFFLKININPLVEILEYQFVLYKLDTIKNNKDSLRLNIDYYNKLKNEFATPLNNISFFINPKSNNYRRVVEKNIKSLFPSSNFKPEPKYKTNRNIIDDIYRIPLGEKITFDASSTEDPDNILEELTFSWSYKEITSEENSNSPSFEAIISNGGPVQEIEFPSAGIYKIKLEVYDGIDNSIDSNITVLVYPRPLFILRDKEIVVYDYTANWKKNVQYELPINIINIYPNTSDFSFSMRRTNPKELSEREELIYNYFINSKYPPLSNNVASSIKYPGAIEIKDQKKVENITKATLVFNPIDAPRGDIYTYKLIGKSQGIESNPVLLNIKYLTLGNSAGIRSRFIFQGDNIGKESTIFDLGEEELPRDFSEITKSGGLYFNTRINNFILFTLNKGKRLNINIGTGLSRYEVGKTYVDVLNNENYEGLGNLDTIAVFNRRIWKSSFGTPVIRLNYRLNKTPKSGGKYSVFAGADFLNKSRDDFTYNFSDTSMSPNELDEIAQDYISQIAIGLASFNLSFQIGVEVGIPVFKSKFEFVYTLGYYRALGEDGSYLSLGLHRYF